jgi:Fur family zinc uptake transcriptional regulator
MMQHPSIEQCKKRLKETGTRVTKARLAVWQVLARHNAPLSPSDILDEIKRDEASGNIDPVSIYRTLDAFMELDLVHKVGPMGGFVACSHIDCPKQLHIMTRCSRCSGIEEWDAPDALMAPMMWYLKEEKSFVPKGHLVEVDGICAGCGGNA